MRVLFVTQPADGHINPMLGVSAALRDAGHEVTFATSASYVPRLRSKGEEAIAVGIDWREHDGPVDPPQPEGEPGPTYFERLFLGSAAHAVARDLDQRFRSDPHDVVVRESVEFAASAVAVRHDIPLVTLDFAFPIDFANLVRTFDVADASSIDALRATVGLDPAEDAEWFLGDLVISSLPDAYRGDRSLREPHVVIRPNVVHVPDHVQVPRWVDDLDEAIYVSLGTVFTAHFPQVLNTAAWGAADAGRTTVVTYGASADPAALALPRLPHVHVEEYVPQGPVLDRCATAVTHGGTGTTLGALARGLPVVVIPLGADQHAHAASIERLGAGIVLSHDGLNADAVCEAVREVLNDARYREAAIELAHELTALPEPTAAVPAIESLVASR